MSTPASLLHSVPSHTTGIPPAAGGALPDWKTEINSRLREHRQRRGEKSSAAAPALDAAGVSGSASAASRVAARVAERYSKAPSYQELLAASADAAASAAEAAIAAALEAQAAADAVLLGWDDQQQELREQVRQVVASGSAALQAQLDDVFADPFFTDDRSRAASSPAGNVFPRSEGFSETAFREPALCVVSAEMPVRAASVEHHAPLPVRATVPPRAPIADRARSLVDAFAEAVVPAAQSLPAKLIEFPRELIAPRKQRPRLEEGPLFEQESPGVSLRIFEVDSLAGESRHPRSDFSGNEFSGSDFPGSDFHGVPSGQVEAAHSYGGEAPYRYESYVSMEMNQEDEVTGRHGGRQAEAEAVARPSARSAARPESGWNAIRLGEHPQEASATPAREFTARSIEHGYREESLPALHDLAPISDRLMAALMDGGIVFACFLIAVIVFATCTVHPPTGKVAVAFALIVFGALATFYGWLFMSYGGGSTPGMRYARIALCTFSDENPRRKDLQNRVPATALALLPLGLGVFWALLDEDKLGWHDRMTRTYQRSYRQL